MRIVAVDAVQHYYWSKRALVWGVDTQTGEGVTFAVPVERGRRLRDAVAAGQRPEVDVKAADVLYTRPVSALRR